MGCSSCSSQGCAPAGCKSNGGCSTGGCNKLNTFNWLQDMEDPQFFPRFDIVEVRFKGGRKEFFRNSQKLDLITGEAVVVEQQKSKHLGYVALTGELVKLQMRKKNVANDNEISKIIRIATPEDIEKAESRREKEGVAIYRAREIIHEHSLQMKLSDVEYQFDGTKATFYYSAEERVDFRELIKKLAEEFRVRVEMKQISLRHEAARLGGIGSCGRELCCSTWLSDFKSVTTQAARYQNLSINPQKLSGQCGRLKCCLNYELETYKEALKDVPEVKRPIKTTAGLAVLQKTDIFKKIMWFSIDNDTDWKPVSTDDVADMIEKNKNGEKAPFTIQQIEVKKDIIADETVNLEGNLSRMDNSHSNNRKKKKKKRKPNNRNRGNQNAPDNTNNA